MSATGHQLRRRKQAAKVILGKLRDRAALVKYIKDNQIQIIEKEFPADKKDPHSDVLRSQLFTYLTSQNEPAEVVEEVVEEATEEECATSEADVEQESDGEEEVTENAAEAPVVPAEADGAIVEEVATDTDVATSDEEPVNIDEADLPTLVKLAEELGVKHAPNIGLDTLREKLRAHAEENATAVEGVEDDAVSEEAPVAEETAEEVKTEEAPAS